MMNNSKQDSVAVQKLSNILSSREKEDEKRLGSSFDGPSDIPLEIITFQTPHLKKKPFPIKVPTVSDDTNSASSVAMEPSPHDILLRKTETSSKNPGNIRFHTAAKLAAEGFHNAVGRSEKLTIAQALASAVRASGGRFLDFDGTLWYEIDEGRAIRKCLNELRSQADSIFGSSHGPSSPAQKLSARESKPAQQSMHRLRPEATSSTIIMSSNETSAPAENSMTAAATATTFSAADESTRNLPSRPPPAADGLSRMLSIGRMFESNDSAANLFASNDSLANHMRSELFRSGVSVELPPLYIESEVGQGPEAAPAAAASTDNTQNTNQDSQPEPIVPVESESTALSSKAEFTADLTKSQNSLLQSLVNKMSQGAESLAMSSSSSSSKPASTLDSKPDGSFPERGEPKRTSSGPNVGIFTSREWGSDLGPFQEVDVKDVFQSTINMGDKAAGASASVKAPSRVSEEQKKPSRKTRDWNALVMENLNNSITRNTAPPKQKAAATPADAALFALAAASQERLIEQVEQEKTDTLTSPKKRGASARSRTHESYDVSKVFVEPTDDDVLLGRGGRTNNHPGNKKYLEAKDALQSRYLAADKNAKTPISQELVDIVKGWGGRFLKLDANSNQWYEIDNLTARKKASQTLREINTPEERALKRAKYAK